MKKYACVARFTALTNHLREFGGLRMKLKKQKITPGPVRKSDSWTCPHCNKRYSYQNQYNHRKICQMKDSTKLNFGGSSLQKSSNSDSVAQQKLSFGVQIQGTENVVRLQQNVRSQIVDLTDSISMNQDSTTGIVTQSSSQNVQGTVIQEDEEEKGHLSWLKDDKYSWLRKHVDDIHRFQKGDLSKKGRGKSCNTQLKNPTPCDCRPAMTPNWENIFVDPPNPLLSKSIDAQDWHRVRCFFWIPELFFWEHVRHLQCPNESCNAGEGSVVQIGWNKCGPRTVSAIGREYSIVCLRYRCKACSKQFCGYDRDVVKKLPLFVQNQLPCVVYPKVAIDNTLLLMLCRQIIHSQSFQDFQHLYQEKNNSVYSMQRISFETYSIQQLKYGAKFMFCNNKKVQDFGSYSNCAGYGGQVPSQPSLILAYKERQSAVHQDKSNTLMSVKGEILCGDHTFKIAKVPVKNQNRLFKGCYSVMNEFGLVCGFYFVHSTGLKEIQMQLSKISQRYVMGGPQIFYTDNCCHDRAVLQQCFPSLLKPFTETHRAPLSTLQFEGEVVLIKCQEELKRRLLTLNQNFVGFDMEWDKVHKAGIPERPTSVIQICDGKIALIVQLSFFAELPQCLVEFMQSKVIKAGVNISGDSLKLLRDFGLPLLNFVDVEQIYKDQYGSVNLNLQALCEEHLQKTMSFKHACRISPWSSQSLSSAQIQYAVDDVYASFLLYYQHECLLLSASEGLDQLMLDVEFDQAAQNHGLSIANSGNPSANDISAIDLGIAAVENVNETNDSNGENKENVQNNAGNAEVSTEPTDGAKHQRVLLDSFHFIDRYKVSKHHFLYKSFLQFMSDATFVNCQADVEAVKKYLSNKQIPPVQLDWMYRKYLASGRIRRIIPEAEKVAARVDEVVTKFHGMCPNFINKSVLETHQNQLKHLLNGCLSDPPGVNLYRQLSTASASLLKLKCARGSSKQEGFHFYLRNSIKAKQMSQELADLVVMDLVFQWNCKMASKSKLMSNFGMHDFGLMQALVSIRQQYPDLFDAQPMYKVFWTPMTSKDVESFGCLSGVQNVHFSDIADEDQFADIFDVPESSLESNFAVINEEEVEGSQLIDEVVPDLQLMWLQNFIKKLDTSGDVSVVLDPIYSESLKSAVVPRSIESEQEIELFIELVMGQIQNGDMINVNELTAKWNIEIELRLKSMDDPIAGLESFGFKHQCHMLEFLKRLDQKAQAKQFMQKHLDELNKLSYDLQNDNIHVFQHPVPSLQSSEDAQLSQIEESKVLQASNNEVVVSGASQLDSEFSLDGHDTESFDQQAFLIQQLLDSQHVHEIDVVDDGSMSALLSGPAFTQIADPPALFVFDSPRRLPLHPDGFDLNEFILPEPEQALVKKVSRSKYNIDDPLGKLFLDKSVHVCAACLEVQKSKNAAGQFVFVDGHSNDFCSKLQRKPTKEDIKKKDTLYNGYMRAFKQIQKRQQ
ncbi:hypothetical protein MP228_011891 [Amoeboaphelidium protococcarum]|nr:hypothetical protein MP228_011891 [Amoeboaphelidium protococcarum]